MQIISAALAFAIIMLLLSMVVASLVETIHRLFGMRERGLYYLLGRFYDNVLSPYRRNPKDLTWHTDPALRSDFQDRMSEIRAPVGLTASTGSARISSSWIDWDPKSVPPSATVVERASYFLGALWRGLKDNWRGRGLAELSPIEFMTRLGAHPLSDRIMAATNVGAPPNAPPPPGLQPPDRADIVLQDIAQKFESYAAEASVSFERRARSLSIAVAIAVAFLLHVNAAEIFSTFMRDPALAEAVIAKQQELTKPFEARSKEVEKQIPAVAANAADLPGLQQAAKDIEDLKREYRAVVDRLKGTETQLKTLGVPIGWNDERWVGLFGKPERHLCESAGKEPRRVTIAAQCAASETFRVYPGQRFSLGVFLGLLLGGLLVGLGGPFWKQMVDSLTIIRNTARGQQTQPAQPANAAPARGAGGAEETPQPRTPVDAFKAARAGWIAAGRPSVR